MLAVDALPVAAGLDPEPRVDEPRVEEGLVDPISPSLKR